MKPTNALAVGWLETRIPEEMAVYPGIVRLAHAIIAEGFSSKVIKPGRTTCDDVVWWFREKDRRAGPRHLVPAVGRNPPKGGEGHAGRR